MIAFDDKKPETVGVNMLIKGSAQPAFAYWLKNFSDMQDHLPYLAKNSGGHVVELGVRGGVSTSALLAGIEKNHGMVTSIDIDENCGEAFKGHSKWEFIHGSSLDRNVMLAVSTRGAIDFLLIDTEHTYDQLNRELHLWAPIMNQDSLIAIHDVMSFPQMALAAKEFTERKQTAYEIRTGSNGLGLIHI